MIKDVLTDHIKDVSLDSQAYRHAVDLPGPLPKSLIHYSGMGN